MRLSELIRPLPEKSPPVVSLPAVSLPNPSNPPQTGDPDVGALVYDSRRSMPGACFVCIRGERFDGHDFIGDAIRNGACAVIADDARRVAQNLDIPCVIVPDTRLALPILANSFYGHPSRKLKLVGVTGTKGKTTTTYLIESALRRSDLTTGVIGTLGTRIRGKPIPHDRTTPESADLQELLARMVEEGVQAAAMEVSSHALALGRTAGCEYDVAVFTNLTHDHLDFHGTLEDYLETKLILFREYPCASKKRFFAVINADDPAAERVHGATDGEVMTYGINNPADIRASGISAGAKGVSFDVAFPSGNVHIVLKLGGMFNVYNSLGAFGAGLALGLEAARIKAGLEAVSAVDGRFESVDCGQDFSVIVDYAHSPDSLENVLRSARELTAGRLIVVFGCGGDRDRKKRPVMGRIGSEMADVCIVTSDNPRSEKPEAIIEEILGGVNRDRAEVEAVADRREAIRRALEIAGPGDLVVVAGKGHETYQIFKDHTIHFDDREVVHEILCGR